MTDFDRAIAFVFKWEGGYVNDPRDPGGETHWGISKRAYPMLDIKDLQKEEAADIYRHDYWEKSGADKLMWPLNLVVFDTAVNMGVRRAKDMLEEYPHWKDYIIERIAHYARLRNFSVYGRGWINRVIDLYHYAASNDHPLSEEGE